MLWPFVSGSYSNTQDSSPVTLSRKWRLFSIQSKKSRHLPSLCPNSLVKVWWTEMWAKFNSSPIILPTIWTHKIPDSVGIFIGSWIWRIHLQSTFFLLKMPRTTGKPEPLIKHYLRRPAKIFVALRAILKQNLVAHRCSKFTLIFRTQRCLDENNSRIHQYKEITWIIWREGIIQYLTSYW